MTDATWALIVMATGWALVLIGVLCLSYVGFCSRRNGKALARATAVHDKILRKEHLARLRHRDFDAFCTEINNMRARRNEKPIPLDLLRKVQYNLMYTIDED
jgi:hypothetical protein